jgi:hypothetical protein
MSAHTSDIAFTPAVKSMQAQFGSRDAYRRMEEGRGWPTVITPELSQFIGVRDSFYMATATADGRPYVQHRGGAPGFLRVLDKSTLGFADLRGNRQYISLGNLSENDRTMLFLMDYAQRRRVKIWGRAREVDDDHELTKRLAGEADAREVERAIVIAVEAWDVNCPKYITPRLTVEEFGPNLRVLKARIAELEAEVQSLRQELLDSAVRIPVQGTSCDI